MIDIVDRLKFDATRCEVQFSKGVAGNIAAAAEEIERLRAALKIVSEDVYLDEYQLEYRPTSAALTARAALASPDSDVEGTVKP